MTDYTLPRTHRVTTNAAGYLVEPAYGTEDIDAGYPAYLAQCTHWTTRDEPRPIALPAVAAAAQLGTDDRAAGIHRLPHTVAIEAADRSGHPRTTTHPGTYGQCPIIDDNAAHILRAYMTNRYPQEPRND